MAIFPRNDIFFWDTLYVAREMLIVFILNRQGTLSYLYQSSYENYIFTLTMLINITTKYTFYLLLDVASMSQQHKVSQPAKE